jgi:hypothetical protein
MYKDPDKERRAAKFRMRRFRAKRKGLLSHTGVTERRVVRTDRDQWFPEIQPIEERLLAKIEEQRLKMAEAEEAQTRAQDELNAYYRSLGIIDPEQAKSGKHIDWIYFELRRQLRAVTGHSKAAKAERARLGDLMSRALVIKKERFPEKTKESQEQEDC